MAQREEQPAIPIPGPGLGIALGVAVIVAGINFLMVEDGLTDVGSWFVIGLGLLSILLSAPAFRCIIGGGKRLRTDALNIYVVTVCGVLASNSISAIHAAPNVALHATANVVNALDALLRGSFLLYTMSHRKIQIHAGFRRSFFLFYVCFMACYDLMWLAVDLKLTDPPPSNVLILTPLLFCLAQLYRLYSFLLYFKLFRCVLSRLRTPSLAAAANSNPLTAPWDLYVWCDPKGAELFSSAPFDDPVRHATFFGVSVGIAFGLAQVLMIEGYMAIGGWVVFAELVVAVACTAYSMHRMTWTRSLEHAESLLVFVILSAIALANNSLLLRKEWSSPSDAISDFLGIVSCVIFPAFLIMGHLSARSATFVHVSTLRFTTAMQVLFNLWLLMYNIFAKSPDVGDLKNPWTSIRVTALIGFRFHCVVYFASMTWPNAARSEGQPPTQTFTIAQDPAAFVPAQPSFLRPGDRSSSGEKSITVTRRTSSLNSPIEESDSVAHSRSPLLHKPPLEPYGGVADRFTLAQ